MVVVSRSLTRTDAMRRASARYDKSHTRQIVLKLNINTDADILARLDSCTNRQGYIKRLIRQDMLPSAPLHDCFSRD